MKNCINFRHLNTHTHIYSIYSCDFQFIYVDVNSMSNLIVIHSIINLYFCGIKCNGYSVQLGEKLWRTRDFVTCLWLARDYCNPWKATWGAHVGSSNDSSVKGISWLSCDLANLRLTCKRPLTIALCVFPYFLSFFTHTIKAYITHKIVRRVSERKP